MNERIVDTAQGRLRGAASDGVSCFLGVPYADAPVGPCRFAPPRPVAPWAGVRDAAERGPNAPQSSRLVKADVDITSLVRAVWDRGDRFLSLNVWAPDPPASRLPVMVFIHGGAFVAGDKDAPVQDGRAFARSGVVLFAVNYRLGVEGFLPIPGAPANLGLRDQIAALEWVRRNAAAFGGDPDNVTVFGESAGAMSVADLMASPLAAGLFRRAIIESGHGSMVRSFDVARRLVRRVARALGVPPDLDGFGSRSVEQCVAALERVQKPLGGADLRESDGREPAFGLSAFLPVHGDEVLPRPPLEAVADGAASGVDLLIGTNRDEMNLYLVPTVLGRLINRWTARLILGRSEPLARPILAAYGLGRRGRRSVEAFGAATTDLVFRLPARRFAAAHRGRTHVYEFGWRSPACGGMLGACHGLELPFVFNALRPCAGPRGLAGEAPPQELADRVHRLWVRFATGEPLPWPEYNAETRQVCALESGSAGREPEMTAERFLC
jgi:para-nitrobenzyl esterase